MSIASEITRLQTSKADSKAQINIDKDIINDGIDFINNEKVDSYDEKIAEMQEAYKAFIPVITTSNTQIDAPKGGIIIGKTLKGNTSQSGTPTPDAPIEVNNVTGEQVVKVCGKNLLPNNAITQTINGVTLTVNSNKSVTLNGTASAIADFYMFGSSTDTGNYLYIPKGTYSISTPGSGWFYIGREKTLGAVSGNLALLKALSSQDCYFYGFFIRATSGSTFSNLTLYPQIEKGSSASDYQEYQSKDYEINLGNIELNKIGNYQDRIYKNDGKWYIEKNVLKLVVPNAVKGNMQNSNKRFFVSGTNLGSNNILRNTSISQTYGLYCDILGEVKATQTWGGTQGISYDYDVGKNLGCLDFAISGLTTIAEYQNALKGKAIYAIANTPEYTLIDNEDLIEQLEKMMPLLEGQNNISVDGSIPAYMDLDYIVRADKYLIGNRREGK